MADDKSALPAYLRNDTWEEELNFKLWTTSGSKFRADKRCKAKARWSLGAVTMLTSYLIILGIVPLLPKPLSSIVAPEVLSFTTTTISILLLGYSLIEASENYALKAHRFHECGLRIQKLYADLRQAKDIANKEQQSQEVSRITSAYHSVLETYENHEAIDYTTFQTSKRKYFSLTQFRCFLIWTRYYVINLLTYHFIIVIPPVLFAFLYLKTTGSQHAVP